MVFICTANALTLITVCLNRNLWNVHNMYVISLAVADFLTGLTLPYHMVSSMPYMKLVFDRTKYLCLFKYVILSTMILTSIVNIVTIAVDRWVCIAYPHKYDRLATIPKAGIIILFVWTTGIIIGTMPLYINKWELSSKCRFDRVLCIGYQVYCQGSILVLSGIIIAACYGHMLLVVKRRSNTVLQMRVTGNTMTNDPQTTKFKSDWKLVKMFSIIIVVFFICSAPSFVYVILSYSVGVPDDVNSFTIPLLVTNSGMNFIIYVVKNSKFRKALKATCLNCRTTVVAVR